MVCLYTSLIYLQGESKRVGKVFNPATGEQSAEVKLATAKDVNEAVKNAKNAFENKVSGIVIGRSLTKGNIKKNVEILT